MTKVLLFIALGVVALFFVARWTGVVSTVPQVGNVPLSPDQFTVRTKGWSAGELEKILADFATSYGLPAGTFRAVAGPRGTFQVEVDRPIKPDQLLYLVNYLHYPKDFDLTGREPRAAATVALGGAMGGPSELAGRKATIYVPSNDTEFDLVYARVEPASYFEISFTNLLWLEEDEGREPRALSQLVQ